MKELFTKPILDIYSEGRWEFANEWIFDTVALPIIQWIMVAYVAYRVISIVLLIIGEEESYLLLYGDDYDRYDISWQVGGFILLDIMAGALVFILMPLVIAALLFIWPAFAGIALIILIKKSGFIIKWIISKLKKAPTQKSQTELNILNYKNNLLN
jgi:hypothetical protein